MRSKFVMDFDYNNKEFMKELKKTKCPTLLLIGLDDSEYSIEYSLEYRDLIGKSVKVKGYKGLNYFGSNYFMQKELSKNLSNNILDFVKKLEQDEF